MLVKPSQVILFYTSDRNEGFDGKISVVSVTQVSPVHNTWFWATYDDLVQNGAVGDHLIQQLLF